MVWKWVGLNGNLGPFVAPMRSTRPQKRQDVKCTTPPVGDSGRRKGIAREISDSRDRRAHQREEASTQKSIRKRTRKGNRQRWFKKPTGNPRQLELI